MSQFHTGINQKSLTDGLHQLANKLKLIALAMA